MVYKAGNPCGNRPRRLQRQPGDGRIPPWTPRGMARPVGRSRAFPTFSIVISAILVVPAFGKVDLALRAAIEHVESGGDASAVGDEGRAVGCLQIHKILVDDANRILGRKEFSYADRSNRERSYKIYEVIVGQWSDASRETIARRWNGGPSGEKKSQTKSYWARVARALEEK
jgi:hypothetical protein